MSSYQGDYTFEYRKHKRSIVMLILLLVGLIFDVFQSNIFSAFSGQSQTTDLGQLSDLLGNSSQVNSTANDVRFLGVWKNTTNGADTLFTFTDGTLLVDNSSQIQYYTFAVLDDRTFTITSQDGQPGNVSYEFASDSALMIDYHGSSLSLIKVG